MDIIYALALTLLVNGAEVNYPISYSNTIQECQQKSHRIIFIIKQIEPEATNVVRAKCIKITVLSEPHTDA